MAYLVVKLGNAGVSTHMAIYYIEPCHGGALSNKTFLDSQFPIHIFLFTNDSLNHINAKAKFEAVKFNSLAFEEELRVPQSS